MQPDAKNGGIPRQTEKKAMFIGIDPGATGGIALLTCRGGWVSGIRTPMRAVDRTTPLPKGKKAKREVDIAALRAWAERNGLCPHPAVACIAVERNSAMPGEGVTSAYSFGMTSGLTVGALSALQVGPILWVRPGVWKADMGLLHQDKRASLAEAARLWPDAGIKWGVLANDGIAEAALIALWAIRSRLC